MVIQEADGEQELMKVWGLVVELSDQLTKLKSQAAALNSQSAQLKNQTSHSSTGFVLKRFNHHLTKDEYDAELERMNTFMSTENLNLQYDNKQLNSLLKEYEKTLENIMTTFRKRAHDVQEHELSLMRQYESALIESESAAMQEQLISDSAVSFTIAKSSKLLRAVMRLMGGEDPEASSTPPEDDDFLGLQLTGELHRALDRECELHRLEKENEELRRLFEASQMESSSTMPPFPKIALPPRRPKMLRHRGSEMSFGDVATTTDDVDQHMLSLQQRIDQRELDDESAIDLPP